MKRVESEYAQALYDLTRDEGLSDRVLEEMRLLGAAFRTEDTYLRVLSAPNISKEERCGILDEAFRGKVQPYVLNFMKLLTEKGYIRHFPAACAEYEALYNEDHGILTVSVSSAVPLSKEQKTRLAGKLGNLTGKEISLKCTVDPSVLGGVRLDFDGKRMDDTVRHRLDSIRTMLESATL
ncbi:MAG: ATP synthase F1 subunit delta [Clostridia bacterium]|nr:ATP synthase F1 subunit delta [Clostridia bacterium]